MAASQSTDDRAKRQQAVVAKRVKSASGRTKQPTQRDQISQLSADMQDMRATLSAISSSLREILAAQQQLINRSAAGELRDGNSQSESKTTLDRSDVEPAIPQSAIGELPSPKLDIPIIRVRSELPIEPNFPIPRASYVANELARIYRLRSVSPDLKMGSRLKGGAGGLVAQASRLNSWKGFTVYNLKITSEELQPVETFEELVNAIIYSITYRLSA